MPSSLHNFVVLETKAHLGPNLGLGSTSFGACVECLNDQGLEFKGGFQDLLDRVLIDHHRTSRDHPQVDALVERMVQTCKKGL
jgi:hypothetical protein